MRDREQEREKRKRPRTCIGCGQEFPKRSLIRIVRKPSGEIEEDSTGRAPGRGVYICRNRDCVQKAQKRNLLSRSLKSPVPAGLYENILSKLQENQSTGENDGGDISGKD